MLLLALTVSGCGGMAAHDGRQAGEGAERQAAKDAGEPSTGMQYGIGIGVAPGPAQLAAWDIDVQPDGINVPAGPGTVAQGRTLYA
ncbi:MAG: hypothetical protein ACJ8G3_12895 [Burkholderiaceae bacterium]